MKKEVSLFTPGSIKGFRSSPDPLSIPSDNAALLQNTRLGLGAIQARWKGATLGALPLSGTVVGAAEFTTNGILTWYVAISNGTVATCYKSTNNGTSWTSITPTSGPYGDTRLACTASQNIYFGVVRDRSFGITYQQEDLIVMQNGFSAPIVYGPASGIPGGTGDPSTAPASQPLAPTGVGCSFAPEIPMLIRSNTITATNSGGQFVGSLSGSAGNGTQSLTVAVGATTANGDTVIFKNSTTTNFANAKQYTVVLGNITDLTVLNNIQIEIGDGTNYDVIYNGQTSITSAVILSSTNAPAGQNWRQITVSVPSSPTSTSSAEKWIRLTWVGASNPVASSFGIYAFCGGYTQFGGSNFGFAWYAADSRSLGPATIVSNTPSLLSTVGGPFNTTVQFTEDQRILGKYAARANNSTQTSSGIATLMVYRQQPGETSYYWVYAVEGAAWSGSAWVQDNALGTFYTSSNELSDYSKPFPVAGTLCLPIGTAMAAINGRLFVASGNRFYYSAYEQPTVFRIAVYYTDAANADPLSAGSFVRDGETIQTIVPFGSIEAGNESLGAPTNAASSIYFLTNHAFYRVSGWDAISLNKVITIAPHGTVSPFSVARNRTGMYWLDDQQQVRYWAGGSAVASLSLYRVDNYTTAVSSPGSVVGDMVRDKYFLLLPGTTPRALVFDEYIGEWVSLDSFDFSNTAWLFSSVYNNLQRCVCLRSSATTGGVFEHDQPNSSGTVTVNIQLKDFSLGLTQMTSIQEISVMSDGYTGGTLTTNRGTPGYTPGSSVSGIISLTDTNTLSCKYDSPPVGVKWYRIRPSISGTVPGNYSFYAAFASVEATDIPYQR